VRARCLAPITPGIPNPRPVSIDKTPATTVTWNHHESQLQHRSMGEPGRCVDSIA
jgi:hypothetical protein